MALLPLPLMAAVGTMSTLLASTFTWIWAMPMYLVVTPAGSLAMVTVAVTAPLLPALTAVTVPWPSCRETRRTTLAALAALAEVTLAAARAAARASRSPARCRQRERRWDAGDPEPKEPAGAGGQLDEGQRDRLACRDLRGVLPASPGRRP